MRIVTYTLGTLLLFCSCCAPKVQTESNSITYSSDINTFALSLLNEVCKRDSLQNVCISPASAGWALSMVANGADGNTLTEILSTLGIEDGTIEALNQQQQWALENIPSYNSKNSTLSVANSVWINECFKVKKEFVNRNKSFYDAEVNNVPFDAATLEAINSWCSKKTNGKITSILEELNNNSKLILINALYLNSQWTNSFKNSLTKKEFFTKKDGDIVKCDMMHHKFNTRWFGNNHFQMASKPLGRGDIEMIFILPNEGVTTDSVAQMLTEGYTGYREQMINKEVALGLPKFKVEYNTSLNTILKAMGMNDAFNINADFSNISKAPLFVSDIIQKSYIAVDEYGVEAAAVTSATIGLLSRPRQEIPQQMIMDRPFLFIIAKRSDTISNILFAGKIEEPTN
ncbi:MAG: serpin family protein [Bacteroidaceae bacterium]|nr:serpin family protein [Bacteroidaceae bacterium]